VIIASQAVGGGYTLHRLSKEHPKLAVTLGIAVGAMRASIAVRNIHVAKQMRRR
jgi:hypothetical protein